MISDQLRDELLEFRKERDWEKFHNLRTLSTSIALEAAELMEFTHWAADEAVPDIAAQKRKAIAEEIADIAIFMTYLAHDLGLDIETIVTEKLKLNGTKYPVDRSRGTSTKYDQL
jgi:NTP pyrophosphatase (non-canonical NTP hydrolase)